MSGRFLVFVCNVKKHEAARNATQLRFWISLAAEEGWRSDFADRHLPIIGLGAAQHFAIAAGLPFPKPSNEIDS